MRCGQIQITRLEVQGKFLYYQAYAPTDEDPIKKPFVIAIQYEFINDSAKRMSATNSWALHSIFKTNQYGLSLYAAIIPNQDEIRIPVFYIICSNDMKQR